MRETVSEGRGKDISVSSLQVSTTIGLPPAPPMARGTLLAGGSLQVVRRLGEGGMGIVYEAFDSRRVERVALKTVSRLDARNIYQFKNEFRALVDVAHPNLVRFHELSTEGELWYFTMELIEGLRFDRWVRRARKPLDEERLRAAMAQLINGVCAVHAAGKLHRDLKPSNVLVSHEGRVVVLDFGLAVDPEEGGVGQTVLNLEVSGTPAYMAPEQAAGRGAECASDFYAVGVMLFKALTGRLPFSGRTAEILIDKQRTPARRASEISPDIPPELDELCARLLSREPGERPTGPELREFFPVQELSQESLSNSGKNDSSSSGFESRPSSTNSHRGLHDTVSLRSSGTLVGRDAELSIIREAYEATLKGKAVVLFVEGESGMGKTALCESFLEDLRREGHCTVLTGRCYEREHVPFKGLDSLVDDLSRHLRKLPEKEAALLLPREIHALTHLFPALGRVEIVAEAPVRPIPDPQELRNRAYGALGELLARLRDGAPWCLHLDDTQWLDEDAVAFLGALLVDLDPPPGLWIFSHRSEGAEENQALARVRRSVDRNNRLEARTLELGPLSEDAAERLAQTLLHSSEVAKRDPALSTTVARESAGSPFFTAELCRFVGRHEGDTGALNRLSLGAALSDHFDALPISARTLLEVAALAGQPLPARELLSAALASHNELDLLRGAHLLKVSRLEESPIVECYHDKVRETALSLVSKQDQSILFNALATTLAATTHPDPELLARCFEGAGQLSRAAECCAQAGAQAMAATAFLHAARLYEKALAQGQFKKKREHALRVALGEALSLGGRGKEAAAVFLRAADDVTGWENRDLRRRAALDLGATGHTDKALPLFHALFSELGLPLPLSRGAALIRLLTSYSHLRVRGFGHVRRPESECSEEDLQAFDVRYALAVGFAIQLSPLLGGYLAHSNLLHALRVGEAKRIALASNNLAFFLSFSDTSTNEDCERLRKQASDIGSEPGNEWLRAQGYIFDGEISINHGLLNEARPHFALAFEAIEKAASGSGVAPETWQIDTLRIYNGISAHYCGDWDQMAETMPRDIEQAYDAERFMVAVILSYPSCSAWLRGGDSAGYRATIQRAKQHWRPDKDPSFADMYLAVAEITLEIYCGRPREAYAVAAGSARWFGGSLLTKAPSPFSAFSWAHGQSALAALRCTENGASAEKRQLAALVRSIVKSLERVGRPVSLPFARILSAGLALHAQDQELAREHLQSAVTHADDAGFIMVAAAARRRLGQLVGGDQGRTLLETSETAMRNNQVVDLEAITEMLCTGCRCL